jgi:hypothetical protein
MPRHTHRVGGPAQRSGAAAGAPAAAAGLRLSTLNPDSLALWQNYAPALCTPPGTRLEAFPVPRRRRAIRSCCCRRRQTTQAASLPVRLLCPCSASPPPVSSPCLARADLGRWRCARFASTSDRPSCLLESSRSLGWCAPTGPSPRGTWLPWLHPLPPCSTLTAATPTSVSATSPTCTARGSPGARDHADV